MSPLTLEADQERARPIQRHSELPHPIVSAANLSRARALPGKQRLSERDLQIELALSAPVSVRQIGNQRQPATEKCNRLREHRARPRLASGAEPIVNRLLRQPAFLAMVGEQ